MDVRCLLPEELLQQCKELKLQVIGLPKEVHGNFQATIFISTEGTAAYSPENIGWQCYQGLLAQVRNFLVIMPLVDRLHNPSMQGMWMVGLAQRGCRMMLILVLDTERHWENLMSSTGKKFDMNRNFSLKDLLELALHRYPGLQ